MFATLLYLVRSILLCFVRVTVPGEMTFASWHTPLLRSSCVSQAPAQERSAPRVSVTKALKCGSFVTGAAEIKAEMMSGSVAATHSGPCENCNDDGLCSDDRGRI